MIGAAIAIGLVLALGLASVRLFIGPTLYDRAWAAISVLVLSAVTCAALAVSAGDARWADVALVLAAATLVAAAAVLRFFRVRSFQPPLSRDAGGPG